MSKVLDLKVLNKFAMTMQLKVASTRLATRGFGNCVCMNTLDFINFSGGADMMTPMKPNLEFVATNMCGQVFCVKYHEDVQRGFVHVSPNIRDELELAFGTIVALSPEYFGSKNVAKSICFEVDAKPQEHESTRVLLETGEFTIFRLGQVVRYHGTDAQRQYTVRSMEPSNAWLIANKWTTNTTFEYKPDTLLESIDAAKQALQVAKKVVREKELRLVELEAQLSSQQEVGAKLSEVVVK